MFIQARLREYLNSPDTSSLVGMFTEMEQELARPIRVLVADNESGPPAPRGWHHDHYDSDRFTLEEARSNGITVWHYLTPAGNDRVACSINAYLSVGGLYVGSILPRAEMREYGTIEVNERDNPSALHRDNYEWTPYLRNNPDQLIVNTIQPNTLFDLVGLFRYASYLDDVVAAQDNYADLFTAYKDMLRRCCDPEFVSTYQEWADNLAEAALRRLAARSYDTQVNEIRQRLSSNEGVLANYQSSITVLTRMMRQDQELLMAVLAQRESGEGDVSDRIMRDIQALRDHPRFESVTVDEQDLTVTTTDDLRLTHPRTGESRWLGSFTVSINIETLGVTIINNNTARNGRQHPHVNGTTPCFGGHDDAFRELLLRADFYLFMELLLQYLESLNINDSWGAYGAYWFDVPDERPLEATTTNEGVTA